MNTEDTKKEYFKKYYQEHKEKISEQMTKNRLKYKRLEIVGKLNTGEYKRLPLTAIEKYDIKYDENNKIYY